MLLQACALGRACAPAVNGQHASLALLSIRRPGGAAARPERFGRQIAPIRGRTPMSCAASSTAEAVTIVGGGRIGSALVDMCKGPVKLVKRGEPIGDDETTGPIIVCTRNDALGDVLEATPKQRWEDLVFIQNGMLQPWLKQRGLEDNTQALVYFAVSKLGEKPIDGKTDVNPEGLTAVNGKHASAFAAILESGGLACKVLDKQAFQECMLEKLIWISAFMLVGVRHGCSVGEVESAHKDETVLLINELAAAGCKALGISLGDGMVERLCAYARSVAHYPTAIKEFEWRNGWFYNISKAAMEAGQQDPCPMHTSWLQEAGIV